jgi:hypothetical protein
MRKLWWILIIAGVPILFFSIYLLTHSSNRTIINSASIAKYLDADSCKIKVLFDSLNYIGTDSFPESCFYYREGGGLAINVENMGDVNKGARGAFSISPNKYNLPYEERYGDISFYIYKDKYISIGLGDVNYKNMHANLIYSVDPQFLIRRYNEKYGYRLIKSGDMIPDKECFYQYSTNWFLLIA